MKKNKLYMYLRRSTKDRQLRQMYDICFYTIIKLDMGKGHYSANFDKSQRFR